MKVGERRSRNDTYVSLRVCIHEHYYLSVCTLENSSIVSKLSITSNA